MRGLIADYLLPFVLFMSALFILCYRFRKENYRLYLISLFVVLCVVRWFV